MMSGNEELLATIRGYMPGIALPVDRLGMIGSGTTEGWEGTDIFLERDSRDPDVWRATADLLDGEVKFRVDENYSIDWGVSHMLKGPGIHRQSVSIGSFHFVGDIKSVFPRGTAQIAGMAIPVKAGRYDIAFNTRTFEYVFEQVSGDD